MSVLERIESHIADKASKINIGVTKIIEMYNKQKLYYETNPIPGELFIPFVYNRAPKADTVIPTFDYLFPDLKKPLGRIIIPRDSDDKIIKTEKEKAEDQIPDEDQIPELRLSCPNAYLLETQTKIKNMIDTKKWEKLEPDLTCGTDNFNSPIQDAFGKTIQDYYESSEDYYKKVRVQYSIFGEKFIKEITKFYKNISDFNKLIEFSERESTLSTPSASANSSLEENNSSSLFGKKENPVPANETENRGREKALSDMGFIKKNVGGKTRRKRTKRRKTKRRKSRRIK